MAKITFKGKIKKVYFMDDTLAYEYIQVPELDRKHCDIAAFRNHAKYGAYANSDLFMGMLKSIKQSTFRGNELKLNSIPEGVSIDTSGFLAVVTFEV